MALNMKSFAEVTKTPRPVSRLHHGECPLRGVARSVPVRRVRKSLLAVYMTVMMDVFSHSSWNGW